MSTPRLHITIPGYFDREVGYVIHVLLKQQLGISNYILERKDQSNFLFTGPEGTMEINNVFFNKNVTNLFTKSNLPTQRIDFHWPGRNEKYTALYGEDQVYIRDRHHYCGPDLIASTFFLLTQWESNLKETDVLGRYRLQGSTIDQWDLYKRPLVNEYVQLLKTALHNIGITGTIAPYEATFSCDVDSIQKYKSYRNLAGAIYHSGFKPIQWKKEVMAFRRSQNDRKQDPYYSFEYMIQILEKYNLPAVYYFTTGLTHKKYDHVDYSMKDAVTLSLVARLKSKKIQLGLHPSFETGQSKVLMEAEKRVLEENLQTDVKWVRQHYLRYKADTTWKIQDDLGFDYDSSVQFTEGVGFAAGCCTPYSLFSISERRMTHLTEWPLILMKKKDYVKDVGKSFSTFSNIIDTAKRYHGRFQVLFHNSDVETESERQLFEMTLHHLSQP